MCGGEEKKVNLREKRPRHFKFWTGVSDSDFNKTIEKETKYTWEWLKIRSKVRELRTCLAGECGKYEKDWCGQEELQFKGRAGNTLKVILRSCTALLGQWGVLVAFWFIQWYNLCFGNVTATKDEIKSQMTRGLDWYQR